METVKATRLKPIILLWSKGLAEAFYLYGDGPLLESKNYL